MIEENKKRYVWFPALLVGFSLCGFGGFLSVYCGLGSDPFNVLAQGLAPILHIKVGTTGLILQLIFLLLMFVLDRKSINPGSIIGIIIIAAVLNTCAAYWGEALGSSSIGIRAIFLAFFLVVTSLGIAIVQITNVGPTPNDMVPFVLYKKIKLFQYRTVRIAFDCTELILGMILGGTAGVGTIVIALLLGPCIQFALSRLKSLVPR